MQRLLMCLLGACFGAIPLGSGYHVRAESQSTCRDMAVLTAEGPKCLKPGEAFADGKEYPEMIVMPSGGIAAGKFEVTFHQFDAFAKDTVLQVRDECASPFGHWDKSYRKPGFEQKPTNPVVCINWDEAAAYASWLSRKTGRAYRLPTLAEAETILRDGGYSAAMVAGQDTSVCRIANVADRTLRRRFVLRTYADCNDKYVFTSPAGMKEPDRLGLFDVIGNVEEMVDTCPGKDSLACGQRAVIGGSWMSYPDQYGQGKFFTFWRFNTIGFRLVRELHLRK